MRFPFLLAILAALPLLADEPPRSESTVTLDAIGVANLGIETIEAAPSTFERTIFALGEIQASPQSRAILSSRVAGRIAEVRFHVGEFVTKGEVLIRVESRQPGDPPAVIDLTAPQDGVIVSSDAHLGAPVEPDRALLELQDLSRVWVVARVPQQHAADLAEGRQATIRVPSLGHEGQLAELLRLGTAADFSAGTADAVFELPNPDSRLRPGARAEVELLVSRREDVLSIPRAALQGDRANRFVFIRDYELETAFVRVPVTVGEISAGHVEILSGLFPGDEVVTRGAYELSFAGKGTVSLKEALDAAHGHPHNEDGSEMSAEDLAAASSHEHSHDHDHDGSWWNPLSVGLALACSALLLLTIAAPRILRGSAQA